MAGRDPRAVRASLDARLHALAQQRGQEVNRLRRHLVFQRMLRRLDGTWVLKGGYLLETRLGTAARATKDLDLSRNRHEAETVDAFADALAVDVDADGFVFRVVASRPHLADPGRLGGTGTSLGVTAMLAGRVFAKVRVDVVSRPEEIAGGTERLALPTLVSEPGWGDVVVTAVDLAQHIAEKLHALSEVDAHPRPSTRVKDLVDVVLVVDSDLLDEQRLSERLHAVFSARDGAPPPPTLPDPPAAWAQDYPVVADGHPVSARTVDDALLLARSLYARALARRPSTRAEPARVWDDPPQTDGGTPDLPAVRTPSARRDPA